MKTDELARTIGAVPEIKKTPPPSPTDPRLLQTAEEIRSVRGQAANHQDAVARMLRTLVRIPSIVAVSHFHRADDGEFIASTPLICRKSLAEEAKSWESQLADGVAESGRQGHPTRRLLSDGNIALTCTPIGGAGGPTAVLCTFSDLQQEGEENVTIFGQLAAAELAAFVAALSDAGEFASGFDGFLASVDLSSEVAFSMLATNIEKTLGVTQVLIGTVGKKAQARLQAISGVSTIKRPSALVTASEDVLSETALRGSTKVGKLEEPTQSTQAENQLLQLLRAARIVSGPLKHQDQIIGGWIAVEDGTVSTTPRGLPLTDHFEKLAVPLSGLVMLLRSATPSRFAQLKRDLSDTIQKQKRSWLLVSAVCLAILAMPIPTFVRCDCELQPVTRRYVPAPYDGILNEVLVKPGDVVKNGQVLARMDRQQIEWQIAAQDAELESASKKRDSSLAVGDTSSAQVAGLEMERIRVEKKLFRRRLDNLEIRSTIDGLILAGDPNELQGSKLSLGQTLFECGPLSEMIVEVLIPDDQIGRVHPGQNVKVRLDAVPYKSFRGRVQLVSPQAEQRNNDNVFVAEVLLQNQNGILRPGMAGRSRVSTGGEMLVWSFIRKPLSELIRIVRW